jgi:hypothetical protein
MSLDKLNNECEHIISKLRGMKVPAANQRILISLIKYGNKNEISIARANYAIGQIHKIGRPFRSKILFELSEDGLIEFNGRSGMIRILV